VLGVMSFVLLLSGVVYLWACVCDLYSVVMMAPLDGMPVFVLCCFGDTVSFQIQS
jgi:hypothetical protein